MADITVKINNRCIELSHAEFERLLILIKLYIKKPKSPMVSNMADYIYQHMDNYVL